MSNSVYFVSHPTNPDFMDLYVTNNSGASVKRILNESDIQALIATASTGTQEMPVLADITERDAFVPTVNTQVYVIDATDDPTVSSGAAMYIYTTSDSSWHKTGEIESFDLVLDWASIQNKPTSSVSAIDQAVSASHSHSNKTVLDKIGENEGGYLTYDGQILGTNTPSVPTVNFALSTAWGA